MRKIFVTFILLIDLVAVYGQPNFSNLTYPSTVNLFDLYEIAFTLGPYQNPYDPDTIQIYGLFYGPNDVTCKVEAFYYEDYTFQKVTDGTDYYETVSDSLNNSGWRIRFTPTIVGNWNFTLTAVDAHGIATMPDDGTRRYHFVCNPANEAKGFITKANSRYLKRDVVKNGHRQFESFFPIGPNIAWYSCMDYGSWAKPHGIYEYESYLDSLNERANYLRIWLDRYQSISLFGPEYTHKENGEPRVYFDSIINQKDSAELDWIITYAAQHGIAIMPCIFCYGTFNQENGMEPLDPSIGKNNPFNTILGLDNSCDFFTDENAKRITKNLMRYIVSRWGYATNIMAWEFWNEVDHMICNCEGNKHIEQDVIEWHQEMYGFLHGLDPYNHCISTSMASTSSYPFLSSELFQPLDFAQLHRYENIQNAESVYQLLFRLYKKVISGHTQYPSKPYFIGEFGFAQSNGSPSYQTKDPFGVDLHNSLWASFFSSSMGAASFWWWPYVNTRHLYKHFLPLFVFSQTMPILSNTFSAHHTGSINGHVLDFSPNNLQTYYMINEAQDSIYGWCQDTAFAYQSLRWLTDSTHIEQTAWGPITRFKNNAVYDPLGYIYKMYTYNKPAPSSDNNIITLPITNQLVGTRYLIRWYDSETGLLITSGTQNTTIVQQDSSGNKFVSFAFPSAIRDTQQHVINNKYGDAVFRLILSNQPTQQESQ